MVERIKWAEPDIGQEEIDAVVDSLKTGYVGANGPLVREFEEKFARKVGARYALTVSNGTSGLLCALSSVDREKNLYGSLRVAVPTFTFIASANATSWLCHLVGLIDCSKKTWNIEPRFIQSYTFAYYPNHYALMTVDVGGLPCDYDSFKKLKQKKNLLIVADSAESVGARYKGEMVGTQADIHVFSFHRAKIMTTGEGGMVTTNNKELYEIMTSVANHGYDRARKVWEYRHSTRGLNFRMTETQAAIGLVQLKKLDKYVKERRQKARIYKSILGDLVRYQDDPSDCLHPFFFFGILVENVRDHFVQEMTQHGVEVKTWTPIHQQRCYHYSDGKFRFPNATWVAERIVLLPIHNRLTEEQTKYVAETAKKLLKQ